jgi:hypothetical protein
MNAWPLLLAQREGEGAAAAAGGAAACMILLVELALIGLVIAGMWLTFTKAGKPGWAAIIPIYNIIVLLEIVGKPIWWVLLFLVPCVNIVMAIIVALEVARVFGKGVGFGLGLAFLPFIFYPLLGFSDARYQPMAAPAY